MMSSIGVTPVPNTGLDLSYLWTQFGLLTWSFVFTATPMIVLNIHASGLKRSTRGLICVAISVVLWLIYRAVWFNDTLNNFVMSALIVALFSGVVAYVFSAEQSKSQHQ
jgi:hypothetical protein